MQDLMDKIGASNSTAGGNYIQPGYGVLIVDKQFPKDGHKGLSYIAEFVVKESHDIPGSDRHANAVGSSCVSIQKIGPGKHQMTFMGNVKAMIEGICGEYPSKEVRAAITNQDPSKCDGVTQALRGTLVGYETYQKTSASSGEEMTLVRWHTIAPDKGNSNEEIAKRRKELEAREGKSSGATA
jgi:hypothetical protein